MTGTDMIMEQLKLITGRLDKMDGRLDKMDGRLDKMEKRLDNVENRLDNVENRLDNVEGSIHSLRTEMIQRMDDLETALDTEINKVYLMAVKNADDIQLLVPYKDKILNVSSTVDKIEKLEQHQQITDEVLAMHSKKIAQI